MCDRFDTSVVKEIAESVLKKCWIRDFATLKVRRIVFIKVAMILRTVN